MKKITYTGPDGKILEVEYDPEAPCWYCGYPVGEASMGGTVVCGACDMGRNRFTMKDWSFFEWKAAMENWSLCVEGGKPSKIYEDMFNEVANG